MESRGEALQLAGKFSMCMCLSALTLGTSAGCGVRSCLWGESPLRSSPCLVLVARACAMWASPHAMGLQRKSSTCHVVIGGKISGRSVVKCLTRWNWCLVQCGTTPNLAGFSWFLLKSKQALESSPGFLFRVSKPQGFNSLQRKPCLLFIFPLEAAPILFVWY